MEKRIRRSGERVRVKAAYVDRYTYETEEILQLVLKGGEIPKKKKSLSRAYATAKERKTATATVG